METKEILHRISDKYITNKKVHILLDCLAETPGVSIDDLLQLLVSTDEEVDMLPSVSTIDLKKVETLIRENRKKWNNGVDDIITIEVKNINIFNHTIKYVSTIEIEKGKVVSRYGDFAYDDPKSIMP